MKAVVFDVDGVLTPFRSAWKRLHDILGVDANLNRLLFERGYIDYVQWAVADVALWRNVPRYFVEAAFKPREGFDFMCSKLKETGVLMIALSAGVSYTRRLSFCFDEFLVNDVIYNGESVSDINVLVTNSNKAQLASEILSKHGVRLDETVAVGDSETDIPLLEEAGFSIAFNPTSRRVEEAADVVIRSNKLYLLTKYLLAILKSR